MAVPFPSFTQTLDPVLALVTFAQLKNKLNTKKNIILKQENFLIQINVVSVRVTICRASVCFLSHTFSRNTILVFHLKKTTT